MRTKNFCVMMLLAVAVVCGCGRGPTYKEAVELLNAEQQQLDRMRTEQKKAVQTHAETLATIERQMETLDEMDKQAAETYGSLGEAEPAEDRQRRETIRQRIEQELPQIREAHDKYMKEIGATIAKQQERIRQAQELRDSLAP